MTVEARLRESIRAYEAVVIVEPPMLEDLDGRAPTRTRPRVLVGAAVVALVAIAAGILLVLTGGSGGHSVRSIPPVDSPTPAPPAGVLAAQGSTLVLLDSGSGAPRRTIAQFDLAIVTVTSPRSGDVAYVTVPSENGCDDGPQMYRVSLVDGARELLGSGTAPTVSADGRHLAYSSWDGCSVGAGRQLRLRDLDTGQDSILDAIPDGTAGALTPIAWSPEGTGLLYEAGVGEGGQSSARFRVWTSGSGATTDLQLPAGATAQAFGTDARHVVYLAGSSTVGVLDLDSGEPRVLFRFDREIVPGTITADAASRELVFTVFGAIAHGSAPAEVWRWGPDSQPRPLAPATARAAWSAASE